MNKLEIVIALLKERKHCVVVNEHKSSCDQVRNGVLHETKIWPVLFTININKSCAKCKKISDIKLFADDTKLYNIENPREEPLKENLGGAELYLT